MANVKNVLGTDLESCSISPKTGFYRDGYCNTSQDDFGAHTVCAQMTSEFLEFTKKKGNDLSTPNEPHGFPGLKPGEFWCLCVLRWKEAMESGVAPPVKLEATNEKALEYVSLIDLTKYSIEKKD